MEIIFDILNLAGKGIAYLVAAIVGLIVLTIIFGKKIESRYDLEAEFKDENGKEFADFDLKSWRYEKEAGEYQLDASFEWRDSRLLVGDKVSVCLDELLVLEGMVEQAASVRLSINHIKNSPKNAQEGDECRVFLNDKLILKQVVIDD